MMTPVRADSPMRSENLDFRPFQQLHEIAVFVEEEAADIVASVVAVADCK